MSVHCPDCGAHAGYGHEIGHRSDCPSLHQATTEAWRTFKVGQDQSGEIMFVGNLQRLELKPGERFVLTIDRSVPFDVMARIQQAWKAFWAEWAEPPKLLVLDGGMKLGAINTEASSNESEPGGSL